MEKNEDKLEQQQQILENETELGELNKEVIKGTMKILKKYKSRRKEKVDRIWGNMRREYEGNQLFFGVIVIVIWNGEIEVNAKETKEIAVITSTEEQEESGGAS